MKQQTYRILALVAAIWVASSRIELTPVLGAEPDAVTSESTSNRFVAVGKLARRGTTRQGRPRYALLDEQGQVASYVAATAGLDLRPHEGRQVGITARSVSLKTDTPYILAEQVTPFEPGAKSLDPAVANVAYEAPVRPSTPAEVTPAQHEEVMDYEGLPEPFEDYSQPVGTGPVESYVSGVPYGGHAESCPTCGHGGVLAAEEPCTTCGACPCGPPGRIWARAEYLMWWLDGMGVPPLVTTSPQGTARANAGVIGQTGTEVLFGGGPILDGRRDGGRFRAGMWLDGCQWLGLEGEYLFLSDDSLSQTFSSTGTPILARPFFNVLTPARQDSELVAFPGVVRGSVSVDATSSLQSVAPRFRINLCCEDMNWGVCDVAPYQGFRFDVLLGYRYMNLDESLNIREELTTLQTNPNAAGFFDLRDSFATENTFHGGEVSMAWEAYRGPWSMELLGRLGIGNNTRRVSISGSTVTSTQTVSQTASGGLLALPSNIGTYEDNKFALIPELDLILGYALSEQLRFTVGYTFMYWDNVVRPGEQIDLNVNPNLMPPTSNSGPRSPSFAFRDSSIWAQGLSLGLDYRW